MRASAGLILDHMGRASSLFLPKAFSFCPQIHLHILPGLLCTKLELQFAARLEQRLVLKLYKKQLLAGVLLAVWSLAVATFCLVLHLVL